MRIMVIGGYARSLTVFRGTLLQAIKNAGHEVIACAAPDDGGPEILAKMGITFVAIPLQRTQLNPGAIFKPRCLGADVRRYAPDIVLLYVKPVIYGSVAAVLARIHQRYAMITGLGHSFMSESFSGKTLQTLVGSLYRLALSFDKNIFFQNSDDSAEDLCNATFFPICNGWCISMVPVWTLNITALHRQFCPPYAFYGWDVYCATKAYVSSSRRHGI
ncbi:MAG: glycosyltransferase [Myxococcota bacterium]